MGFADLPLAAKHLRGDGAGAEDFHEIHGAQSVLLHQELQHFERRGTWRQDGAVFVLFTQVSQQSLKFVFLGVKFALFFERIERLKLCGQAAELLVILDRRLENLHLALLRLA